MDNVILITVVVIWMIFILVVVTRESIRNEQNRKLVGRIYNLIGKIPDINNIVDVRESILSGQTKILSNLDDQCGSRSHRILYTKMVEIQDLLTRVLAKTAISMSAKNQATKKIEQAMKDLSNLGKKRRGS